MALVPSPQWLDTGDNAWQLAAATFVALQSIPGLTVLYGGIVKKKWAINSAFMSIYAFASVMVVWVLFDYNLAFGPQWFPFLGTPGLASHEIALGYRVPASLDLRPLIGRRVLLVLEEEPSSGGCARQTLTVRTSDDRVWLIARSGNVAEASHTLGSADIRLSLSPTPGGPLVVAAPELQHIVTPGGEARMRIGASRYVVELVSRDESGWAAYFIADDRLWH